MVNYDTFFVDHDTPPETTDVCPCVVSLEKWNIENGK
jgi:hypothetical protein